LRAELIDTGGIALEPAAKNLFGMRAQPGGRRAGAFGLAIETNAEADLRDVAIGALGAIDEAGLVQRRVLRHFVESLDRPRGHAGLREQFQPFGARTGAQQFADQLHDVFTFRAAVLVAGEGRIGSDPGLADRIPEALPDAVVAEAQGHWP